MSGAEMSMSLVDWSAMCGHFMLWSLLSIGGVITTAPDMHRYLVDQRHWLSDLQFSSSIAIAQAAPGPNILFVALFGWNIGLNAGSTALALLGAMLAMGSILAPSSVLVYLSSRWSHANRERRSVRAFKQGMAPVVVALMLATGWLLARAHGDLGSDWPLWLLTATCALLIWRTRLHILWLLATGALLGGFGLV